MVCATDSGAGAKEVWLNTTKQIASYTAPQNSSQADLGVGVSNIGGSDSKSYRFDGILDEIRYYSSVKTDEWYNTMYNMWQDHANFGTPASA